MSISWRGATHCGFFLVPRGGGRLARQRSPPETLSHPLSHQNACKCSAGTSTSALWRYAALRTPAERLWLPNRGRGCHRTWVAHWQRQRPHTLAARRSDPTQLCPPAPRFFVLAIVWYFPSKKTVHSDGQLPKTKSRRAVHVRTNCVFIFVSRARGREWRARYRPARCHAARPNTRRFAQAALTPVVSRMRSGERLGARHGTELRARARRCPSECIVFF